MLRKIFVNHANKLNADEKEQPKVVLPRMLNNNPAQPIDRTSHITDEYSDPERPDKEFEEGIDKHIVNNSDGNYDDEFSYSDEEDEDSEYDDGSQVVYLPEVDQRNLNSPEKLAKYAETIYSIARQDVSELKLAKLSSHQIRQIQNRIPIKLHEFAVKWVFQFYYEFKMTSDTLYEAITYLNLALSKEPVDQDRLQLITITCIWIASKMEEKIPPKLEYMKYVCRNQYQDDDFVQSERKILTLLDFKLNFPTSKMFLRRLLDAISAEEEIVEVSTFFCDISLLILELVDYTPMEIGVAAVCLGKICLNRFCPAQRLLAYAHLTSKDTVKECCYLILQKAQEVFQDPDHIIFKKFPPATFGSLLTEANLNFDLISKV